MLARLGKRRTWKRLAVSSSPCSLWPTHPATSPLLTHAGFGCTNDENNEALATLSTRTWLSLRRKLEEQTSDANLLSTLRGAFEERFRYDESGVPRVWKPEDDLEGLFMKAKEDVSLKCSLVNYVS